jgi:dynein light chain LC8-type
MKLHFDKLDGPAGWNCVVGRNFGSHIIHQTKKYVFFQIKELSFLLWKA